LVRRFGATLGIFALLFQLVIPVGQGVAAPTLLGDIDLSLVVCRANGPVSIPVEPARDKGSPMDCPICQIHSLSGALVAAALLVPPYPVRPEAERPVPPSRHPLAIWRPTTAFPRGPPAIV